MYNRASVFANDVNISPTPNKIPQKQTTFLIPNFSWSFPVNKVEIDNAKLAIENVSATLFKFHPNLFTKGWLNKLQEYIVPSPNWAITVPNNIRPLFSFAFPIYFSLLPL